MKTGIGNKVTRIRNNIHNEKGWLALTAITTECIIIVVVGADAVVGHGKP